MLLMGEVPYNCKNSGTQYGTGIVVDPWNIVEVGRRKVQSVQQMGMENCNICCVPIKENKWRSCTLCIISGRRGPQLVSIAASPHVFQCSPNYVHLRPLSPITNAQHVQA